jgi:hypothetical protein
MLTVVHERLVEMKSQSIDVHLRRRRHEQIDAAEFEAIAHVRRTAARDG